MTRPAPRLPSRREVLAGGVLLLAAGCLPAGDDARRPPVSPEQRLRLRIAGEVRELAARYAAVIARFPATRAELSTLAAEHEAHAAALLGPQPTGSPAPTGSAAPRSSAPVGTLAPSPAVPATVDEAVAALAAAERAASRRRSRQAGRVSPRLARLLASVAASEAVHAALLERAR